MSEGWWVSVYCAFSDPERLAVCSKPAVAAVEVGGGRVFVRGGRVVVYGGGVAEGIVLVECDSLGRAVAAHWCVACREALVAFCGGVERGVRIVEGID